MKLTTDLRRTPAPMLVWRFACADIASLATRFSRHIGYGTPAPYTLSELSIPDSLLAIQATRLVSELSPPFLFNHSVRSYLFGEALGRRGKMSMTENFFTSPQ